MKTRSDISEFVLNVFSFLKTEKKCQFKICLLQMTSPYVVQGTKWSAMNFVVHVTVDFV